MLRRSGFVGRKPLRAKKVGRSPEQQAYFLSNKECRICGKPACDVHHISQNRQDDSPENLESLCWIHHRSERGIHLLGVVKFCEWYMLTKDPKWKTRYERFKRKEEYHKAMEGK